MRMSRSLREVFLDRIIRIEAVQRERAAAMEEVRREGVAAVEDMRRQGIVVTEEDVEFFFDFGMLPSFNSEKGRSPLWEIETRPIEPRTAEEAYAMKQVGLLSPALLRALVAASEEWHRLIRKLRHRKLIATGEKFGRVMTIDDRHEIGPETWLGERLWFDVRANAIYALRQDVGLSGSRLIKLWDDITVREAGDTDEGKAAKEQQPSEKLRREMAVAIWKRLNPQGYDNMSPTDLMNQAKNNWDAECKKRGVSSKDYKPPEWDSVARWTGRRPD
jgi:hypothetical protein